MKWTDPDRVQFPNSHRKYRKRSGWPKRTRGRSSLRSRTRHNKNARTTKVTAQKSSSVTERVVRIASATRPVMACLQRESQHSQSALVTWRFFCLYLGGYGET